MADAPDAAKGGNGDQAPAGMSEEDVGRIVNSAITSHMKRLDVAGQVKAALGELNLGDLIKAEVEKIAPKPPPSGGAGDDAKPKTDPAIEARLRELAEQLEKSEAARLAEQKSRAELEQRHKRSAAKQSFRDAVAEKIRPDLLGVFVDHFADSRGLLKLDDNGAPVLTVKHAPYKGAAEEDVDMPLDQAVPLLLAQKDVHPFLPAPGGQQGAGGEQKRPTFAGIAPTSIGGGSDGSDSNKAAAVVEQLSKLGIDASSL